MNESPAQKILRRIDPAFIPRWTVYKNTLISMLTPDSVWIDVGCGDNSMVRELKRRCRSAVGIDVLEPDIPDDFIKADISQLPFPDNYADVVTLRFVVEHLSSPDDLKEVLRVLKPNGRLLFITTNLLCPFVGIPRIIPFRLKNALIRKIFTVEESDIFPTYHRLNTPGAVRNAIPGFRVTSIHFLSDLNTTRFAIFALYSLWHVLTMPSPFRSLRANILAVYSKKDASLQQ
jgi:SAM-dependent methyltransferase